MREHGKTGPSRRSVLTGAAGAVISSPLLGRQDASSAKIRPGESFPAFCDRIEKAELVSDPALLRALRIFGKSYPGHFREVTVDGDAVLVRVRGAGGESRIPLEDGHRSKSFRQRLDSPDLVETLFDDYPTNLDFEHWPENLDPGRYRVEKLFRTVYGDSPEQVRENLVPVDLAGKTIRVNRNNGVSEAFARLGEKLERVLTKQPAYRKYTEKQAGTFSWRKIAGTDRLSSHSFGITIDLNPALGGYWRWGNGRDLPDMGRRRAYPPEIVEAFESEKFVWGGKWFHYDLMHFEFRPELFD